MGHFDHWKKKLHSFEQLTPIIDRRVSYLSLVDVHYHIKLCIYQIQMPSSHRIEA